MPKRFAHYTPHPKDLLDNIWEEGVIVPDTNILLHLYRSGTDERNNLLQILSAEKIEKRLWFPHQVAKEFFRNRRNVIVSQHKIAGEAEHHLKKAFEELEGNLKQIRKSHPYFHRDEWIKKLTDLREGFVGDQKTAREAWPASLEQDTFLESIEKLMEDRIGDEPEASAYKAWTSEAKDRESRGENYPSRRDANDKDKQKEPDKGLGDFFIWMEMQARAKKDGSHVVFVTDDEKDDWWEKHEGKRMGPHPEYRREWTKETKSEFVLCGLEPFLKWANGYITEKVEGGDLTGLLKAVRDAQVHSNDWRNHWMGALHGPASISRELEATRNSPGAFETIMRDALGSQQLMKSLADLQALQQESIGLPLNIARMFRERNLDTIRSFQALFKDMHRGGLLPSDIQPDAKAREPDPLTPTPVNPTSEEIIAWFYENFDDPATGVPHDSSEGGNQYIFGGPRGAEEVIQSAFPEVDGELLKAAISGIEASGTEWVRKGLY